MFLPKLVQGPAYVYSINDPACDRTRDAGGKLPWLGAHLLHCGTRPPPTLPGQKCSRFELRLLDPGAAMALPLDSSPTADLAWYAACVVSMDTCTDRDILLGAPGATVCCEVGGYARRLNIEISRPFLRELLQAPSPTQGGSTASAVLPSPKAGTPKRTKRSTKART